MRVLVTGASGLLGRGVVRVLMARGHEVTVVQRRPAGLACREVRGDLADSAVQRAVVANQDAVVHLAAKVDVTGSWADFYRTNVEASRGLLDAARQAGVSRFVHVSSPSVAHCGNALFGAGAGAADPRSARGNYARSKAIAERVALRSNAEGFAVVAIRPHLVWGPGDTQLVGRIIARARTGRLPLIAKGSALIDTTYIDNAADALVAALDRADDLAGKALVVSNGEPRTVGEILNRLCAAAGVPAPRRTVPYRAAWTAGALVEGLWSVRSLRGSPGDPPMTRFLAEQLATAHWFDQRDTQAQLGWQPAVSLDEGFRRLALAYAGSGPQDSTGTALEG